MATHLLDNYLLDNACGDISPDLPRRDSHLRNMNTRVQNEQTSRRPLTSTHHRGLNPILEFIDTCGGNWMWRNINTGDKPKDDMQWVADGMTAGTLIWTTDGSYNRKRAADLLRVGWIIFCKATS